LEKKKVSLKNNVLEQKKEDGRRGLTRRWIKSMRSRSRRSNIVKRFF
jgi:hypothetical protein